jgi:hypothetical protein
VRFRDARPEPDDGSRDKRTAGQILAQAFAGGGAVRLPRGFGKNQNRVPMSGRYQAAVRRGFAAAALERQEKKRQKAQTANQGATS